MVCLSIYLTRCFPVFRNLFGQCRYVTIYRQSKTIYTKKHSFQDIGKVRRRVEGTPPWRPLRFSLFHLQILLHIALVPRMGFFHLHHLLVPTHGCKVLQLNTLTQKRLWLAHMLKVTWYLLSTSMWDCDMLQLQGMGWHLGPPNAAAAKPAMHVPHPPTHMPKRKK